MIPPSSEGVKDSSELFFPQLYDVLILTFIDFNVSGLCWSPLGFTTWSYKQQQLTPGKLNWISAGLPSEEPLVHTPAGQTLRVCLEGLIYGGKFAFQNRLGLPYSWKEIYRFCFVLLCIWGQFPSTNPRGAYIRRGDLTEGFLRYEFGGLIFGGAYFRNYLYRGLFSAYYLELVL